MFMNTLRTYNADTGSIEDLMELYTIGTLVREQYRAQEIEAPEWLDTKLKAVKREITERNADELQRRLKDAKARLDSLKTPSERKAELQKQIAALEKQLAE